MVSFYRQVLRKPQHFQRASPMPPAAKKAALLECGDQPMNAGLRLELQRVLHLFKARRKAGLLQMTIDEQQQFILLLGQHDGGLSPRSTERGVRNKPETIA